MTFGGLILGVLALLVAALLFERHQKNRYDQDLAADHLPRMRAMIASETPKTWQATPSPKLARFQQRLAHEHQVPVAYVEACQQALEQKP